MNKELIYNLLDDAVMCAEVECKAINPKRDFMSEVMNCFCDFYSEATGATDLESQKVWESKEVQDLLRKSFQLEPRYTK